MSKEPNPPKTIPARIELIDNWHKNWEAALLMITNLGALDCLMIDEDGWLSARQNLFVAYVGQKPIGFLCFRVQPQHKTGPIALEDGRPALQVVRSGIDPEVKLCQPAASGRRRITRIGAAGAAPNCETDQLCVRVRWVSR